MEMFLNRKQICGNGIATGEKSTVGQYRIVRPLSVREVYF